MSARYSPGQILLASLVFCSQLGTKKRPVLVVHDSGDDDLLVAPVTSHAGRSPSDIFLNDWKQAGLRLSSVARLDKLATIEKATVVRPLGQLSSADHSEVKAALRQWFDDVVSGWCAHGDHLPAMRQPLRRRWASTATTMIAPVSMSRRDSGTALMDRTLSR